MFKFDNVLLLAIIFVLTITGCAPDAPGIQPALSITTEAISIPVEQPTTAISPMDIPPETPPGGKITVLAAASLTESFTEIGILFEEQNPNVTVEFSFGGSQQLAQQIQQGAPADVFASASRKYMDALIKSGLVTAEMPKVFVENKLVLIVPAGNPAGLENLADLGKPGIKLVLAAKEVPVGQYAQEFLTRASADQSYGAQFEDTVLKNVVSYEENVKAVLAKVVLGEADAGIVYYSDVTGDAKNQLKMILIPEALNTVAKYPIAAINTSKEPELSDLFIRFVLSKTGQEVLEKNGFVPVSSK